MYSFSRGVLPPIATARSLASRPSFRWAAKRREKRSTSRSEEHTSELQSHSDLVCRLLLAKKTIVTVGWPPSYGTRNGLASALTVDRPVTQLYRVSESIRTPLAATTHAPDRDFASHHWLSV